MVCAGKHGNGDNLMTQQVCCHLRCIFGSCRASDYTISCYYCSS